MARVKVRKGMPSVQLTKNEFAKRIRERFYDPDFDKLTPAIDKIIATAWRTYDEYHKSPRVRRAGGYPCKACVSTAMPLCNWPCSCYPNHAMGQVGDWMNDIYPIWAAARGIMIVCPVNWYQAPSSLKLMIDRLVCADGGNPDPTSTGGKDPERAKKLELAGWPYPRHLAGRVFSVVVHGDAAGVENVRQSITSWLTDMELIEAGNASQLGAYVGYMRPYATSHDDLDHDTAFQEEVRNAARSLVAAVKQLRRGELKPPDAGLRPPRSK
jgi:multimeric flavodoxin WrbA